MAKLLLPVLVFGLAVLGFALTCSATIYTVGGTSGWDISTDLSTWSSDKKFNVGDILWFQSTSSNSVCQVSKESYESCNTTNVVESYTGRNTTVTLTHPGDWYFVSDNKLYCLGGMKLRAEVEDNQAYAPVGAPQAATGSGLVGAPQAATGSGQGDNLPQPTSKSNIPTSTAFINCGPNVFLLAILGLIASMLYLDFTI